MLDSERLAWIVSSMRAGMEKGEGVETEDDSVL